MAELRSLWFAGAIWIGAVACEGPPPGPGADPFIEGTRLKAIYQQADGAPSLHLGWYDTHLNVECTFMDLGFSDRLVCIPWGGVLTRDTGNVFTDVGCTDPLLVQEVTACKEPRFFLQLPKDAAPCGTNPRLFSVHRIAPTDPGPFFTIPFSTGATCQPTTPDDVANSRVYRRGQEIPLDSLVSGSYQPEPGPGRIVPLRLVASDGSVQVAGLAGADEEAWDTQRQGTVSASMEGPDVTASRWFPTAHYPTVYADTACSIPTIIGPACRPPAKEHRFWGDGPCGQSVISGAREVGARGPDGASVYYVDLNKSCEEDLGGGESPVTNRQLASYTEGAEIPATAFAAATEVHTGSQQLQLIRAGSADGPPTYGISFFDTNHRTWCSASQSRQAADGVVRCLPLESLSVEPEPIFADLACSVPLVVRGLPRECVSKDGAARSDSVPKVTFVERREVVSTPDGACEEYTWRVHIYPVAERHVGTIYGVVPETGCSPLGNTEETDPRWLYGEPAAFHLVGSEIPAGHFAPVKIVHPGSP